MYKLRLSALTLLAAPVLAAVLLASCQGRETSAASGVEVRQVSQESAGANLRTLRTAEGIYVTYPDLGSLSLTLVHFPLPSAGTGEAAEQSPAGDGQTTYLDRISETPEIGERFGTAPLLLWNGLINVFYSDRERQGTPVLKWVSGPSEDGRWWIDILPIDGDPLAVLPDSAGDVQLYLASGDALVRRGLRSQDSTILLEPCDPAGDVCALSTERVRGITLFDRVSGRLYAVLGEGAETKSRSIYTDGAVHHSILHDDRLRVLLYATRDSTLLLLEQDELSQVFTATPVTLCEGTTSVFLGYRNDRPYFLYTQRVQAKDGRSRYRISLLRAAGETGGEIRYLPRDLVETETPIQRFSVVPDGSRLYVFFVEEALNMFSVDLEPSSSG